MSTDLDEFYVDTALVEQFLGTAGDGTDLYGTAVTVPCYVEGARRVVRAEKQEAVIGVGTLYCDPVWQGTFTPDARVTVAGVAYRAGQVNANLLPGFPSHLAVALV